MDINTLSGMAYVGSLKGISSENYFSSSRHYITVFKIAYKINAQY